MSVYTYECNNGDETGNWVNPSNAWDTTSGTYASIQAALYYPESDVDNHFIRTWTNDCTISGLITKVEVGTRGYRSSVYFDEILMSTTYSGSNYAVQQYFKVPLTTSNTIHWVDVTNVVGSPLGWRSEKNYQNKVGTRPWLKEDINNMYIYHGIAAQNPFSSIIDTGYIDAVFIRVTTSGVWE